MTIQVGYYRIATNLSQWEAALPHPTKMKFIVGTGTNAASCQEDFVASYNAEMNTTNTAEDFTFVRQALINADVFSGPDGFEIMASGVSVTRATEEEARAAFIVAYNQTLPEPFEDVEYLFIQNSYEP